MWVGQFVVVNIEVVKSNYFIFSLYVVAIVANQFGSDWLTKRSVGNCSISWISDASISKFPLLGHNWLTGEVA